MQRSLYNAAAFIGDQAKNRRVTVRTLRYKLVDFRDGKSSPYMAFGYRPIGTRPELLAAR